MQHKDASDEVLHGGSDLLKIFVETAHKQAGEQEAYEALHPMHTERIGTAIGHINRGAQVLIPKLCRSAWATTARRSH